MTSINMLSVIHVCQKCSIKYIFRNKLFNHLRFECWTTSTNANVNHVFVININVTSRVIDNVNKIIVFEILQLIKFDVKSIINNDYNFRNAYYVIALIKNARNDEIVNCCLNIDCSFIVKNRNYVLKIFSIVSIQKLIIFLSIRKIDNIIHKFNEYIVIDLYINDHVINDIEHQQSIVAKFFVEIHIVDDLKINLLMSNDVLNAQKIILNLKKQTIKLINCRNFIVSIDIVVKKNVDQKRIVKSKSNFKISFETTIKISVTFHDKLSKNRDFLFEFQCS